MNQATFFNLEVMSSTRAVKAAQRAREEAALERYALLESKMIGESAQPVTVPDSSRMPSPENSPEPQTQVSDFNGQIDLTLVGEGKKFFWPGELLRCPRCGNKPALLADWDPVTKRPRYRVHCSDAPGAPNVCKRHALCDQPIGDWHPSNRDAIRCWNLAVKLAQ